MAYKMCSHLHLENRCPHADCKFNDKRELAVQLFGHDHPNSTLAAKIYRESPARYAEAQARGRELNLLPPLPKTPRFLET